MTQSLLALPGQIAAGGQQGLVVVGGLHALPAVVGILNELVEGGGQRVPPLLLLVAALQQGQQVRVPVLDKLVAQKVGDLEAVKAPLVHQPRQVGGGDGLLRVKGGAVQGPGRLPGQVFLELLPVRRPPVGFGYLTLGVAGDLFRAAGVALDAEAKVIGGVARESLGSPLDGDEAVLPALLDVGLELFHAEPVALWIPVSGRRKENPALVSGIRKFGPQNVLQLVSGYSVVQGSPQLPAVVKIAGRGRGVVKDDPVGTDPTPDLGQSQLEAVHLDGVAVEPHLPPVGSDRPPQVPLVHVQAAPKLAVPSLPLFGLAADLLVVAGTLGVVAGVVDPVLVVVVNKDDGRLGRRLFQGQHQVGPMSAAVAEAQLPRSRVHPAAGQDHSALTQIPVPVAKPPQGQVLHHQALLPLGDVESGPLGPQQGPVQSGFLRPLLFLRGRTVGLLLLSPGIPRTDVKSARAHGHVKEA